MSTDLCLTAACFDVALPATLAALFVFLGTVLDLVVGAAAAVAQLALGALRDWMALFAAIEAALRTWGAVFVAFFLLATAANGFDVALSTALRTIIILLGAVFTSMVGAAAAFAQLRRCAVCYSMTGFAAVEAALLTRLASLSLLLRPEFWASFLLVLRASSTTTGLTAYLRNVPHLAAVVALFIFEFAIGLGVVVLATHGAGLSVFWAVFLAALALPFALDGFHCLPVGINFPRLVLLPIVVGNVVPSVGLAIFGIDALLFGHDCDYTPWLAPSKTNGLALNTNNKQHPS